MASLLRWTSCNNERFLKLSPRCNRVIILRKQVSSKQNLAEARTVNSLVGHQYHFFAQFSSCKISQVGVSALSSPDKKENEENQGKGISNEKEEKEQLSWIDLYMPREARPYARLARLDKPIGIRPWPHMWSISLTAPPNHLRDFKMIALLGVGALRLRTVGCTINDILDRDIDAKLMCTSLVPASVDLRFLY